MNAEEGVAKLDFDPYELLSVTEDASEKELVKAFRKLALKWHPDKNPENTEFAQKMFLKVSKAFEILSDAAVKAAYDKLRRARKVAKERTRHLDAKRRKLREELEARESGVQKEKDAEEVAARKLQKEIKRLRKQGSKLLETEKDKIETEIHAEFKRQKKDPPRADTVKQPTLDHPRLKVRWKMTNNGSAGYSEDSLRAIFLKYGEVVALVFSAKKSKGSAIVEFQSAKSAESAFQLEKGLSEFPLTVTWISGKPLEQMAETKEIRTTPTQQIHANSGASRFSSSSMSFDGGLSSDKDFESVVLMKMRQAEERKRLIEEQSEGNDTYKLK